MYTAAPIGDSGAFAGYIAGLVLFLGIYLLWLMFEFLKGWKACLTGAIVWFSVYASIAGSVWLTSDPHITPKNIPVIVQQVGEGGQIESTGGKYARNYFQMYVFYQTPEGDKIALRRAEGQVYPQRAILYKN